MAVIGSGISGLTSAYLLSKRFHVTLYEANHYLGGHTNTVSVKNDNQNYLIDTGFIVFNKHTYPLFTELLSKHNIPINMSEMSFSYRSDTKNFEYSSKNLNTLFAQRSNLINPKFYYFINDIIRFNKIAKKYLNQQNNNMTLKKFITNFGFSSFFIERYLIPMAASIWSNNFSDVYSSSARFILQFYANHGLLNLTNQPQWYVLSNGSFSYIPALIQPFKNQIFLNTKIQSIKRLKNHILIKSSNHEQTFDAVLIATHSDEALKMLDDPSAEEQNILSSIKYTKNEIVLHTDTSILPKRKIAWASWNYLDVQHDAPALTYYMNRLQGINSSTHFCVSVNLNNHINKEKIIKQFSYCHPCFDLDTAKIQAQHELINGKNNTYYAGAYWGYGFHEDGVKSAIKACEPLGALW